MEKMNDKEKDELNRWCHTVLLGKCWHEPKQDSVDVGLRFVPCVHCPNNLKVDLDGIYNPDYTSSLNLASIVEAKILDMDLGQKYMVHLAELVGINSERWSRADTQPEGWTLIHLSACDGFMLATADAPTRCKAARAVVEGA